MATPTLPVIDIASLDRLETRRAIDDACRDWGFFQIVNHGLESALIDGLRREMRAFFAQPRAAKQRIVRTAENPWGYFDRELTRNTRDWKQIYDFGPADGEVIRPQWPLELPQFRSVVEAYYAACTTLSLRLLHVLSANLGMPPDHLDVCFQPVHTSFLRLNYYPRCPSPSRPAGLATAARGHLGVNHHTDAGAITLLLQDERPGLEVYHEGRWHLVEPRRDAIVVNIGDIVQVWSNDRYCAAVHRALASSEAARYSAPFFFNPAYEASYAPLPSTLSGGRMARYRSIVWGEFRARRAAGDYADAGAYHEIGQYVI
ncbi:MAG TPA: 2OG-Fe(II) oxygenase family protein [Steroidobacteraceae bacterium]|nr:2OG-Fe(II) oxygenase family protein [Steroidobacteraceae bacterium]